MNINEAFDHTLEVVKEIQAAGFEVEITPDEPHDEWLKELGDPVDYIDPKKWCHVTFNITKSEQMDQLWEFESKLHTLGIYFDTGAGFGGRDWELDWSFSVS